jgi:AraC family transcriptional regulator of adaptative response/methylated-DNA-[protein]-cysteine methyltransferase
MTGANLAPKASRRFASDAERWQAVVRRDAAADGAFFYSVRTTGVYCRPTCPGRLARRENVRFHATCGEAERAGFRPCKRCRPSEASLAQRHAALVAAACRRIESAAAAPTLLELASSSGLSPYHFQRVFKRLTGVSPKGYAAACRARRVRGALARGGSVTQALYDAGYSSSGRFYASSAAVLGMTPSVFRSGGSGAAIRFAVGECWLGSLLVAATGQGVCAILLGDDADELTRDLASRFPTAELIRGDAKFQRLIAQVIALVEAPATGIHLPLDIRGTAFQQRVWEALQKIPAGTTTSYAEIAKQIGRPRAVRAVGQAVAANPLAVAVPCHRVLRADGSLSGYRWGVRRKQALLAREQANATSAPPTPGPAPRGARRRR